MTKWSVHRKTHRTTQKHVEHQDATDIQKKLFLCFSKTKMICLLFIISKMISWRNVELPPWYGQWLTLGVYTSFKLKQISFFLNILWRRKGNKCECTLFNQATEKMNRTIGKQKEVNFRRRGWKKIILSTKVFCLWKSSQVRDRMAKARKKS